jgi:putative tryptophan/tyrosine transport system substrate-binding protein
VRRREFITLIGGAAAWPLAARAQQGERVRRVGVLMGYSAEDREAEGWLKMLGRGLHERGWTDGNTMRVTRWATGTTEQLASHAAELVGMAPDIIVAASTPALAAATRETRSIPIVFVNVADPIGQGFLPNFARPGGNITGFTSFEFSMGAKWVETVREFQRSVSRVVVIFNPQTAPYFQFFLRSIETAASSFRLDLSVTPIHDTGELEPRIGEMAHSSDACLIVVPSTFMATHRDMIITMAARHRVPAIYGFGYYARSGGLASYGFDVRDLFLRAAGYVDRVLKGEKVGDLPVQVPTKYELVINLKTAKALGLEVPPTLLARADEVIE